MSSPSGTGNHNTADLDEATIDDQLAHLDSSMIAHDNSIDLKPQKGR
jgi:hypothetical protein